MLVSHLIRVLSQQSWDSLSNYCQMLNQVFKVSSGTCQPCLLRMLSKSVSLVLGFFDLHKCSNISQVRWKFLCVCIQNFLTNQLVKEFLKIGPHLPKLLSNIKSLTLLGHSVDVENARACGLEHLRTSLPCKGALVLSLGLYCLTVLFIAKCNLSETFYQVWALHG